jgi:hypothetical protein
MPRLKALKSVAHNIGHSFTSLMNYAVDDYAMGHILRFARETGLNKLVIDFVTGESQPAALLQDPISELPRCYTKKFWDLVASSGSDRSLVLSATLTLEYDLTRNGPRPTAETPTSPYVCQVLVVDVRGKSYRAYFSGWWYEERGFVRAQRRSWWNPLRWFQGR